MTHDSVVPALSVVVCTYNRAGSLRQTLSSLAALDVSGLNGEIIIVDNNSSDDTRAAIDSFMPLSPLPARYVFERRQGLSHARNAGVAVATGKVIAFTDDDVLLDPHWLREIAIASATEQPAAMGGKILPKWPGEPPAWLLPELHQFLGLFDHGDNPKWLDRPELWGANLAIRADVFRTLRFKSKFGRVGNKLYGGEESDLLQTLLERGERLLYWPRAIAYHNIPPRRLRKSYFRKWHWDSGEMAARLMPQHVSRSLFGVPYHMYRRAAREAVTWSRRKLGGDGSAFLAELRLVRSAGFAAARMRGLLRREATDGGRRSGLQPGSRIHKF